MADPAAREAIEAIAPVIRLQGAVTDESTHRVTDVTVFGVDERFWQLRSASGVAVPAGAVILSPALSNALGLGPGRRVVVETEEPRDGPLESIHGRREQPARALTLDVAGPPPEGAADFLPTPVPGDVPDLGGFN